MWEERGSMALWPHPKLDEIKAGHLIGAENALHLMCIGQGSCISIWLISGHAMNLAGRNGYLAEQDLLSQMIIAIFALRWHAAFVGPEDFDQSPVDLTAVWLACQ